MPAQEQIRRPDILTRLCTAQKTVREQSEDWCIFRYSCSALLVSFELYLKNN